MAVIATDAKVIELLDALKAEIKAKTGKLFLSVEDYGGQFDEDEIDAKSFTAPAAFTACLGWRKVPKGTYLSGKYVWEARIAVFIVTKGASRPQRGRDALIRADAVTRIVTAWSQPQCIGRPEAVMAENLYSRKLDKKGLALWMVGWWQEVEFEHGMPIVAPEDMPELSQVVIESTAATQVPAPPEPPAGPEVQHTLSKE